MIASTVQVRGKGVEYILFQARCFSLNDTFFATCCKTKCIYPCDIPPILSLFYCENAFRHHEYFSVTPFMEMMCPKIMGLDMKEGTFGELSINIFLSHILQNQCQILHVPLWSS